MEKKEGRRSLLLHSVVITIMSYTVGGPEDGHLDNLSKGKKPQQSNLAALHWCTMPTEG